MKYDHMVKVNGKYYLAGEDVPNIRNKTTVEETLPSYTDSDIAFESQVGNDKQYSKTEINRMSTTELQGIASSLGIEDAQEMTGSTLKKLLIEHYGL